VDKAHAAEEARSDYQTYWPTFKELMDEHDRRMKMKARRI
jgi:hypothetical protein